MKSLDHIRREIEDEIKKLPADDADKLTAYVEIFHDDRVSLEELLKEIREGVYC